MRLFPSRFVSALILIALSGFAPITRAADLTCGDWVEANGEFTLHVLGDGRARLDRSFGEDLLYRYRAEGDRFRFHDMEAGRAETYTLGKDGALRGGHDFAYRLKMPLACEASPEPAPGECRADLDACIERIATMSDDLLDAACGDGVLFACRQRFERQRHGDAARTLVTADPPVCRKGTSSYDENACDESVMQALDESLGKIGNVMVRRARPVPAEVIERYTAICIEARAPLLCREVGEALLVVGLHAEARGALVLACRAGDQNACQNGTRLRDISADTLQAVALTAVPCGRYVSDFSLTPGFIIDSQGRVNHGGQDEKRASLVDGALHLHGPHDDLDVLHAIGDGRLLAVDGLNRFGLYRRDGDAPGCVAR